MSSQIDEIKQKIDIAEVIGSYMRLDRAGRNYKGLCPFHNERTPSFMVAPDRGTWRCFGCGEHGDVISFVEKYEKVSFWEALQQLADKAGVVLEKWQGFDGQAKLKQRLYDLLNLSAEFYSHLLFEHRLGEEGRAYLQERQIPLELAHRYRLGYAPNTWRSLHTYLLSKGFSQSEIDESGMGSRSERGRSYDRFRHRLMFTVTDSRGRVVGFSGRSLDAESRGAKYVNSPEGMLFHKGGLLFGLDLAREALRSSGRAVLVEGNVDVLSSARAGVQEVVAPLGTALTEDQVRLLGRQVNRVHIAFDQDKAGQEAARKAVDLLRQADIEVRVVVLEGGSDPDEVIRRSPEAWRKAVDEAVEVVDFYIRWTAKMFDVSTERGKGQAAEVLLPLFILNNKNKQRESLMYNKIARALDLDEAALRQRAKEMYREVYRTAGAGDGRRAMSDEGKGRAAGARDERRMTSSERKGRLLEEYLLSAILDFPLMEVNKDKLRELFSTLLPEAMVYQSKLWQTFWMVLNDDKKILKDWVKEVPEELAVEVDRLSGGVMDNSLTEDGTIGSVGIEGRVTLSERMSELSEVIREINRLYLKKQLDTISRSLKQAEILDEAKVLELQQRHVELSRQLANLH